MLKLYFLVAVSLVAFSTESFALDFAAVDSGETTQCDFVSPCDASACCDAPVCSDEPTCGDAPSCCDATAIQGACDQRCSPCYRKKSGSLFADLMELERRKNNWILKNVFGICR
jgi:hypothetical protein